MIAPIKTQEYLDSIPEPDDIKDQIAVKREEITLLKKLLRLAEQRQNTEAAR